MSHGAPKGVLGHVLTTLTALGVSALATGALGGFWMAIGGGPMPIHGWIAMGLGVLGTVGLAWLLMALAFKSHREGWDDQVDNTFDPGRDSARDD